ncbi:hypothetical protein AB0M87_26435 [Streptomyces sp. NPDC051320]|uniref:hypothetical protein n=1 Tax=Streptomyces sp. NPDC051320 TaxID=3154644 RepID=UPI00341D0E39
MFRHAIAPTRRFTKASHDVVRHQRLNSDAKILLLYVQGLPDSETHASLSEHALKLGIKGRAYQRAKESLTACGYLHEWRWQGERGRWLTGQLLANVTLTRDEASRVHSGAVAPGERPPSDRPPIEPPPSARPPTVGGPEGRKVGGSKPEEELPEKNLPHPPPEDEPVGELAVAEQVLLSLRQVSRELHLGVREARGLAEAAAEWLRRGVSPGDLRRVLADGLPAGGIRSAVGFLRHRLVAKLPAVAERGVPAEGSAGLVTCKGGGDEHVFRPVGDETHCGRCRVAGAADAVGGRAQARVVPPVRAVSWRERVAEVTA